MILDIRWNPDTQRYPCTTAEMHNEAEIEEIRMFMQRITDQFNSRSRLV